MSTALHVLFLDDTATKTLTRSRGNCAGRPCLLFALDRVMLDPTQCVMTSSFRQHLMEFEKFEKGHG